MNKGTDLLLVTRFLKFQNDDDDDDDDVCVCFKRRRGYKTILQHRKAGALFYNILTTF